MKLKLYQTDAFTDNVFGGNPAARHCWRFHQQRIS